MQLGALIARHRVTLALAAMLAGIPVLWAARPRPVTVDLTVELVAPDTPTVAQLFCTSGDRYSGDRSVWLKYDDQHRVHDNLYRFRAELPCGPAVTRLRFDPVWSDGTVVVRGLRYHTSRWHLVELEPEFRRSMKILNSIRRFAPVDGGLLIESAGNDPFVELSNDLQRYVRPGPVELALVAVLATIALTALLRLLLVGWWFVVAKPDRLEQARQDLAARIDRALVELAGGLWQAAWERRPLTWAAWLVAFAVSSYANWLFLGAIYAEPSPGAALAFLSATFQFQLVVALVLAARGLLAGDGRGIEVTVWWGLLLLAGTYLGDALLYRLNGMHLLHGLAMLLEGGFQNLGRNIGFMKLPRRVLVSYELAIAAAVVGSLGFAWLTARLHRSGRLRVAAVGWAAVAALLFGGIAVEQLVGPAVRSERLVVREQALLPLYPVLRRASDTILSFQAEVEPFVRKDLVIARMPSVPPPNGIHHVFLVILEGIRADVIRPGVAPNLVAFQDRSITFAQAIANGNATHYGWYAIVNSRFPLWWETYRDSGRLLGSAALLAMKRAGFAIRVHTAKDLSYLQSKRIMFGDLQPLYDYLSDHPDIPPPEQDVRVLEKLIEMGLAVGPDERTMNLVFWDSSHFPYRWPEGMEGEFTPYVGTPLEGPPLGVAQKLSETDRPRIFNRYLNTTRFADWLFGRLVTALEGSGLLEESMIVVVGDHGQQFMEHGFMMHGHTLYNEDLHVPLAISVPGLAPGRREVVASQVDIMATILDAVGLGAMIPASSDGVSLLRDGSGPSFASAAAAGIQNTPSIFLLETPSWKLRFDLDARAPKESREVFVKAIRAPDDSEVIPGGGRPEDYLAFIESEFETPLERLGFVRVLAPDRADDAAVATAGVSAGDRTEGGDALALDHGGVNAVPPAAGGQEGAAAPGSTVPPGEHRRHQGG